MVKRNPIENGNVVIAHTVISGIAGVAVSEVEGVAVSGNLAEDVVGIFKRNAGKGIKINETDLGVEIDIFMTVDYGLIIPEISEIVQESIKEAVEGMTGINVLEVNINVVGLNLDAETLIEVE